MYYYQSLLLSQQWDTLILKESHGAGFFFLSWFFFWASLFMIVIGGCIEKGHISSMYKSCFMGIPTKIETWRKMILFRIRELKITIMPCLTFEKYIEINIMWIIVMWYMASLLLEVIQSKEMWCCIQFPLTLRWWCLLTFTIQNLNFKLLRFCVIFHGFFSLLLLRYLLVGPYNITITFSQVTQEL